MMNSNNKEQAWLVAGLGIMLLMLFGPAGGSDGMLRSLVCMYAWESDKSIWVYALIQNLHSRLVFF